MNDHEEDDDLCPDCGLNPYDCECHIGDECGRWNNGKLMPYCAKAGSEECEWECPFRATPN